MSDYKFSLGIISYNQADDVTHEFFRDLSFFIKNSMHEVEILYCDNGSTDENHGKFLTFADNYGLDFKDLSFKFNQGAGYAFDKVLRTAKGELFQFLCMDDRLNFSNLIKLLNDMMLDSTLDVGISNSVIVSRYGLDKHINCEKILECTGIFESKALHQFYSLELYSYKDNLIYSTWRRKALIARKNELEKMLNKSNLMIGGLLLPWYFWLLNVYVFSSTILIKRYKKFSPSSLITRLHHKYNRNQNCESRHENTFEQVNSYNNFTLVLNKFIEDSIERKKLCELVKKNHNLCA